MEVYQPFSLDCQAESKVPSQFGGIPLCWSTEAKCGWFSTFPYHGNQIKNRAAAGSVSTLLSSRCTVHSHPWIVYLLQQYSSRGIYMWRLYLASGSPSPSQYFKSWDSKRKTKGQRDYLCGSCIAGKPWNICPVVIVSHGDNVLRQL